MSTTMNQDEKTAIIALLKQLIQPGKNVLEICNHLDSRSAYFAEQFPNTVWQRALIVSALAKDTTDEPHDQSNHFPTPLQINFHEPVWPVQAAQAIFTIPLCHLLNWRTVKWVFSGASEALAGEGLMMVYGPFKYQHRFCCEEHHQLDIELKRQNPTRRIRDISVVDTIAKLKGLRLIANHAMPENNRLLIWQKC